MKRITTQFNVLLLVLLLLMGSTVEAQRSIKQQESDGKITIDLLAVQQQYTNPQSVPPALQNADKQAIMLKKGDDIAIEAIVADGQDARTLLLQLQSLGLTEGVYEKRMVTGYIPISRISDLKNLSALRFARPAYEPIHNVGAVTSQGDRAMKADVARQLYNVTGAGSKIGVLSDSYNAKGGAANGVASGDLPPNVQVIDDYTATGATDEGRGMMELIYDVAPGVALAFNTAFKGQAAFAKGIRDLAAAGCNIIVDDVFYFAEPYFQDGIIAQAVDEVKAKGVTYFSSAGNHARNSYQNTYSDTPFIGPFGSNDPYMGAHNFNGGDVYQSITVPAQSTIRIGLQWDNPFASVSGGSGAQTDLDLLVYKNGVLQSSSGLTNNLNGDPIELVSLNNSTGTTAATFEVAIGRYAGPVPTLIKWIAFTNGYSITIEYNTNSSTCAGHANAAGAIGTGAAYYRNTPAYNSALSTAAIEGFSSAGGTPILFNVAGQRIATTVRQKPEITAVDGTNTTFFGNDSDGDGFPNFFGTSAAAPHAAGVAALMQQGSNNTLTPDRVKSILEQTALDMDDPLTAGFDVGYDTRTGYGFIQADKAVQASNTAPTVANAIPNQSGTVGQMYSYMIPSNTFTDAETPNSLTLSVSGLPPGISFTAPATINGTPTTTTGSPFSVTVVATDPGGLTANTTFAFTINPSTPASTAPVAPTLANQTATVGSFFSYVVPAFSGTAPITYTASGLPAGLIFDASSRTISGTPTMMQNSLVTITGNNSAGMGSGQFTITVNAAPSGNFAITGASVTDCQLDDAANSKRYRVSILPQYANASSSPISFSVVSELSATTAPGPYVLYLWGDKTEITLVAKQPESAASTFIYQWQSACSAINPSTPKAPVAPALANQTATVGSFFTYTVPAFSGTTPITYSASGLPAGLSFDANNRIISGTPTMMQTSLVTITGTNSAGSGNGQFTITVNAAPPTGGNFAIVGASVTDCAVDDPANSKRYRVSILPQYANASSSPISFSVANEFAATTAPGPYVLYLWGDKTEITLVAKQPESAVSTYQYSWQANCAAVIASRSRVATSENLGQLRVNVLGNPTTNDRVELEIRGAVDQQLRLQTVNSLGRTVSETVISQAKDVEQATVELERATGIYFLRVSTPTQQQTVKLIRQ